MSEAPDEDLTPDEDNGRFVLAFLDPLLVSSGQGRLEVSSRTNTVAICVFVDWGWVKFLRLQLRWVKGGVELTRGLGLGEVLAAPGRPALQS